MQVSSETSASAAEPRMSHSPRHHRNKKASDPFLELTDEAVKFPDQPSPGSEDENEGGRFETLFTHLVLTPLNMVSFVLSLFVVDHQQRQWRLSQHDSGSKTIWARLTQLSWLDPQPYQDSRDSTWQRDTTAPASTPIGPDTVYAGWYGRKKHRAMAKLEIGDAFDMRKSVVIVLLAWAVLGALLLTYIARRMYGWMLKA